MATTTKKTTAPAKRVAKRTESAPVATEVIEGVIVDSTVGPDSEWTEAIRTVETAAAYATRKIEEFHSDLGTGERAPVKAAYAAAAAVRGGWAIDDKAEKTDSQITLSDLGQKLAEGVAKRWDEKTQTYKPYSKAMVTGWVVAGTAYGRGIDPDTRLGKAILARYGQFSKIREAIESENFTVEKVEKAIEAKKADEEKAKNTPSNEVEKSTAVVPNGDAKDPVEAIQLILANSGLTVEEQHEVLAEVGRRLDTEGVEDTEGTEDKIPA